MTPLLYILAGALLWAFFSRYLKVAASLLVFLLSILIAYRITVIVIPEMRDIDWRGFWSGSALGLIVVIALGGMWFYALGWRGRVAATEQDDIERAKAKAAKDRVVA